MSAAEPRVRFLVAALSRVNAPYVWCGKGPDAFDCSGLVTWALREAGGPDLRATHDTHALWLALPPADAPLPGDLAFYGLGPDPHAVSHVMVLGPLGVVFGAAGGDHTTVSLVEAMRRRARVRVEPTAMYRPGFRGYRSLEPYLSPSVSEALAPEGEHHA